jgi:ferric-dicitrate binding protein FerR (iron transport regulator)
MHKERINYLRDRLLSGKLTEEERNEWRRFVTDPDFKDQVADMMDKVWKDSGEADQFKLNADRSDEILEAIRSKRNRPAVVRNLHIKITAAAIMLCVFIPVLISKRDKTQRSVPKTASAITPGKFGATLTLANGTKIDLGKELDPNIASKLGISIQRSSEGQLIYKALNSTDISGETNILSTSKGEVFQVHLADGTKVWLNAASKLIFDSKVIVNGRRRVTLEGEGYFEVNKDKSHPFIVTAGDQTIEVLGTHFNVNCYANEPVSTTTLLEGSVHVKATNGKSRILKPGQFSSLAHGILNVDDADHESAVAWVNGKYILDGTSISQIMRMIERWYDVEVIFQDNIDDVKISGALSRYENMQTLLELIETTRKVHFKVQGRRIIVNK